MVCLYLLDFCVGVEVTERHDLIISFGVVVADALGYERRCDAAILVRCCWSVMFLMLYAGCSCLNCCCEVVCAQGGMLCYLGMS
jgi:hypothetical protein